MSSMSKLRAIVHRGRLVLDEPTDLPDGTVVELAEVDPYMHLDVGDAPVAGLAADERAELDASLRRGLDQARRGESRPVEEFLAELKDQ